MKADKSHIWGVESTNTLTPDDYPKANSLDELKKFIVEGLELAKIPVLKVNMSKRYMLLVRVQGGTAWWSFYRMRNITDKQACELHVW